MTAAQKRVWLQVEASIPKTRCRCELAAAMSRATLIALGGGCKMPAFACPTLDMYRRATPQELAD